MSVNWQASRCHCDVDLGFCEFAFCIIQERCGAEKDIWYEYALTGKF